MPDQTTGDMAGGQEISNVASGDPFADLAEEIQTLISSRAFELFAARGGAHGSDEDDWLRAQAEILVSVPLDVTETETELTVRADVPGLSENDMEVRVAPRAICITGKRPVAATQPGEQPVYFERQANRIFRRLDLPSEVDTNRAAATLANGVLELRLHKMGTGKRIPVRTRAASA